MDPLFANETKLIRILYRNVSNAGEVRKVIMDSRLPVCLLKPNLIVDDFQLSVAISKVLHNQKQHTMTTKSFPTELIYCLSPSKNISESLRTFGTEAGDADLLVVGDETSIATGGIQDMIHGDLSDMAELSKITDIKTVTELYQITLDELTNSSLLDSVITKMATKDYQL